METKFGEYLAEIVGTFEEDFAGVNCLIKIYVDGKFIYHTTKLENLEEVE